MSDDGPRSSAIPPASGPEHDAWLREALRHAPDARASPPPSLSDAILAEARAAARAGAGRPAAASPTLRERALAFWSWLARPPVAAGFASVMAATLVGMLWWDRPMDETMLPAPSSPAVTAPRIAQERDAAADRMPATQAETDTASTPRTDRPPEPARPPAPAAVLRETAPATAKATTPRAGVADPAAMEAERKQRAARAPADERARAQAEARFAGKVEEADAASKDDKRAQAQPRAEPFALAKEAESGEKESAAAKARRAAPPAELQSPAAGTLGSAALDSSEAPAGGRAAAQNAARPAARQPAAPLVASTRPMAPLLASLASEESRWSRRLASGESAAVDAALRTWLAQVQAAAARWEPAGERSVRRDGAAAASTASLRLERDGRAGAVVQIEDGGVLFDPLSGNVWFAPLPPEEVARLRAALPPAPR